MPLVQRLEPETVLLLCETEPPSPTGVVLVGLSAVQSLSLGR